MDTLTLDRTDHGVITVTLNRPDRANSMVPAMFDELDEVARSVIADREARVLVITGAGRAFCAGYDLAEAQGLPLMPAMDFLTLQEHGARALSAIRALRVPVIAAVNGAAAGGGLALALAADIRVGSPAAKFNAAFAKIGFSAGDLGTSWLLPRLVGPAVAAEMAYTGRMVDATEAERIGLLNAIHDDALEAAIAMAEVICGNSPSAVEFSKRALQANLEVSSYAAAIELENRGQAFMTRGDDMAEALAAAAEKRAPRFGGAR